LNKFPKISKLTTLSTTIPVLHCNGHFLGEIPRHFAALYQCGHYSCHAYVTVRATSTR